MWKVTDFKEVPEWLEEKQKSVQITEHNISFSCHDQEFNIYYQTTVPVSENKNVSVLLLHGMRFSSQTWNELGTLNVLAALDYSPIAIDLPGYGKSKDQKPIEDTASFLANLIEALKLDRPVIISPSLSGSYSLPFLLGTNPEQSKARGYIPLAPIFTDKFTEDVYKKCQIPTMIVQGSRDVPMGETASQHLKALPNSHLHIMKDCGHPAYLDNPKEWHWLLYNFLDAITN